MDALQHDSVPKGLEGVFVLSVNGALFRDASRLLVQQGPIPLLVPCSRGAIIVEPGLVCFAEHLVSQEGSHESCALRGIQRLHTETVRCCVEVKRMFSRGEGGVSPTGEMEASLYKAGAGCFGDEVSHVQPDSRHQGYKALDGRTISCLERISQLSKSPFGEMGHCCHLTDPVDWGWEQKDREGVLEQVAVEIPGTKVPVNRLLPMASQPKQGEGCEAKSLHILERIELQEDLELELGREFGEGVIHVR